MKLPRKGFVHRLFVEPLAWAPPHQAWHERAKSARELADLVTDGRAKSLLIRIAETYEQLARSQ